MAKSKLFSATSWCQYGIQLSIVIIGIVVTFVGSDLISRWSRSRQIKAVMHLVTEELKENRSALDYICEKLMYDKRGMLFLKEYDNVDDAPLDSLQKYQHVLGSMRSMVMRNDALEVLKTSGMIQSIGDKSLLMGIMSCYSLLGEFSRTVESYNQWKMRAIDHLMATPSPLNIAKDDPRATWKEQLADPVCAGFFSSAPYYFGYGDDYFIRLQTTVSDTVEAIIKKYGEE